MTPEDRMVLERLTAEAVIAVFLEEDVAHPLPLEFIAAFRRTGYIPQEDLELLMEQLPFEGPDRYMRELRERITGRQERARELLWTLLETDSNREAITVFGQFFQCQFGLLNLFMDCYPDPPFKMLSRFLPVWYHPCAHLLDGRNVSLLNPSLRRLMYIPPRIESYLLGGQQTNPTRGFWGRLSEFFLGSSEGRFRRQVRQLLLASDRLNAYLIEYLDSHWVNLRFRREYGEHPESGWLHHQLTPYDE